MSTVTFEGLAKARHTLDEKRTAIKKKCEDELKDIEAKIEVIDMHLIKAMDKQGLETIKTAYGDVVRDTVRLPRISDGEAFNVWIMQNNRLDMLQRRLMNAEVLAYFDGNGKQLPPGLSLYTEPKIRVRKPRKSKED